MGNRAMLPITKFGTNLAVLKRVGEVPGEEEIINTKKVTYFITKMKITCLKHLLLLKVILSQVCPVTYLLT